MRLLILTQAVDKNDPVLGFFHRWIAEFAAKCEQVEVLCLRMGEHQLPSNVRVFSLGKERGATRIEIVRSFYSLIWSRRKEYDSVLVHMNPEYVLLGGLLWRLLQKKVGIWYVHRKVGLKLRVALFLCTAAFTVSEQSLRISSKKVRAVGHGIDAAAYDTVRTSRKGSILWLGRIDPVKRFHLLLAALSLLSEDGVDFNLDVYGAPTRGRENYYNDVRSQFQHLEQVGRVHFIGSVPHGDTPQIYATHDVFVNLTPEGSFDKTLLEAMASGCLVVLANPSMRAVAPPGLFVETDHVENIAMALKDALTMDSFKAENERARERAYVREHHALPMLIERIVETLK